VSEDYLPIKYPELKVTATSCRGPLSGWRSYKVKMLLLVWMPQFSWILRHGGSVWSDMKQTLFTINSVLTEVHLRLTEMSTLLFAWIYPPHCNNSRVYCLLECEAVQTVRSPSSKKQAEFFASLALFYLVCEATGTAATPGLLCQPRVIVKMIVEKQMECRFGRGNRSSWRKPAPAPLLSITKSHMTRPGFEPGPPPSLACYWTLKL
jgi:hypothetical protein